MEKVTFYNNLILKFRHNCFYLDLKLQLYNLFCHTLIYCSFDYDNNFLHLRNASPYSNPSIFLSFTIQICNTINFHPPASAFSFRSAYSRIILCVPVFSLVSRKYCLLRVTRLRLIPCSPGNNLIKLENDQFHWICHLISLKVNELSGKYILHTHSRLHITLSEKPNK